jgi:hypothetical protein
MNPTALVVGGTAILGDAALIAATDADMAGRPHAPGIGRTVHLR